MSKIPTDKNKKFYQQEKRKQYEILERIKQTDQGDRKMNEQEIPKPFVIEVTPEQSIIVQVTVSNILGKLPVWGDGQFLRGLDKTFLYWKGFGENDNTFTHSNSLLAYKEDEKIYELITFDQFCERYVESKEKDNNKMNEQEKNQEALKQLGIEIPEGWEFVRYGIPEEGEYIISSEFKKLKILYRNLAFVTSIIIKKKIETECWYLVEDEDGDTRVMFLNKDMKWKTYNNRPNNVREFDLYKIISKMVVDKGDESD